MSKRTETDFIGSVEIDKNALYGIHAYRAKENFPDNTPFFIEWYKAVGIVKHACYVTYQKYIDALNKKDSKQNKIQFIDSEILEALISESFEVSQGKHFEHFIVPAISGGAGTSINLNINEIISNSALLKLRKQTGNYSTISPFDHANIYQSTNDVIPTALKVACMRLLLELEDEINLMRTEIETKEKEHRNALRIGFTQMQRAVPTSYGRLFSTYNDALSRDWWRVSKCLERIKQVNIGGSAIGTALTIPKYFVFEVVKTLQHLTGLPVAKAENLSDATSNLDSFAEVHGILKAHAINLEKMVSDLRLLASDINENNEINIPDRQVGSSIMPGKVNPVITEFVVSSAQKVYANDSLITQLCSMGTLELNAYLPTIGHALIDSIKLLIASNKTIKSNLIKGLTINANKALEKLLKSPSVCTVLLPVIGYKKAAELAEYMKSKQLNVFDANKELNMVDVTVLENWLTPQKLLQEGFTLEDL